MKKILFLLAVLITVGAGCVSTVEHQDTETVTSTATSVEETLTDILAAHDLNTAYIVNYGGTIVEYPWMITDIVDNPSDGKTIVVFGEDQSGEDYEPGSFVAPRAFYVLHDLDHLTDNFFMIGGAWEHRTLGEVAWIDDETITYEVILSDEGGTSIKEYTMNVVDPEDAQDTETEELDIFTLVGNSMTSNLFITSNDFNLEVPEDFYVDISEEGLVRVQNYSIALDYMSEGDFFMWFKYRETEPNFADDYVTTEYTTYQGYEVIKGDECSTETTYCIDEGVLDRGYYFTDSKIIVTIFPYDQAGLEAAEALLSTISWK
ncbi:hypothetical protein HN358_01880 [Candidatus Uhrbacteria bacterium]|jgi:hypothetical protein|nr:hypothetical protein [Candidatus Uhrbacteria bacterium]MBT7716855.1 hypothetical protein [Candidatus Uhrbacteria bacterium]